MAMVTARAITSLPSTTNTDRVKPMLHTLRQARQLTRFVLVWFALALGVAMASPLVLPKSIAVVCSSGGIMKLVASDGGDEAQPTNASMDCPLCMSVAFPPAPLALQVVKPSPLSHALQPIAAAHIASATAPPLPSRGPPAL
jgi:hypothetical protein